MPILTYFDSPTHYNNISPFNDVGSSPHLLEQLLKHLNEQQETLSVVYVAFYLYNNAVLNNKLKELAKKGVQIKIVTIPIDGYEALYPKEIKALSTQKSLGRETKYSLAKKIFAEFYRSEIPGAQLYFFPHQYIRSASVKRFSKGSLPYSMHAKSILALNHDGTGFLGIGSSNFAVRDLIKEEFLVIYKDELPFLSSSQAFFENLLSVSIPITEFDFKKTYTDYIIPLMEYPKNLPLGFTAPFYSNSNQQAEKDIIKFINTGTSTIKIAAQHVCPIAYFVDSNFHSNIDDSYTNQDVILNCLLAQAKKGLKVHIISQTIATGDSKMDSNFRSPANGKAFVKFYEQIKDVPNISYDVNDQLHSKYIIVDDQVLISTFNYTPTQFLYLDKVEIKNSAFVYKGIFSECGIYAITDDKATVEAFENNFKEITSRKNTIKIQ